MLKNFTKTGILIKSTSFHHTPYWVVKCHDPNLPGTRNGELPIDEISLLRHPWWFVENRKVKFQLVEIGDNKSIKLYAHIK